MLISLNYYNFLGISQNLERLETLRDLTRKADPDDDHEITR